MDNIDRIMKEADRLGFGCSYGKYRAAHPEGIKDVTPAPVAELECEDDLRLCKICGKQFVVTHGNRTYCSCECADQGRINRQREYDHNRNRTEPKFCRECGAVITQKYASCYCSADCRKAGKRKIDAALKAKKRSGG